MIHSFRKFFEFAGRQSRNWYLGLFYEIIRCILEALQFAALLVVLDGLVHDNITAQTALLAFGIMLVSVIGTAIFWYLAHGKEGEGSSVISTAWLGNAADRRNGSRKISFR